MTPPLVSEARVLANMCPPRSYTVSSGQRQGQAEGRLPQLDTKA